MNPTDLEELARAIAPIDLGGCPMYVVPCDADDLPTQFRGFSFAGLTSTWLDLALHPWLVSCGAWCGRGPAIVVNSTSTRCGAVADADGPGDFADELYRTRLSATFVHELAHVLGQPIDIDSAPDLPERGLLAAAEVARWARGEHRTPPHPWAGHDWTFVRLLLHVVYRAERLLGESLPANWLFGARHYGLSPWWSYKHALGDEPERMAGATFAEIRETAPPTGFLRLWREDVLRFFESSSAVPRVAAASFSVSPKESCE